MCYILISIKYSINQSNKLNSYPYFVSPSLCIASIVDSHTWSSYIIRLLRKKGKTRFSTDIFNLVCYVLIWPVLNGICICRSSVEIPFWALFFVGITWWTLLSWSMTHYDIAIGNDHDRNVHCDMIMFHAIIMGAYHELQCILMLLGPSFIMYYYAPLWYFCYLSKIFKIVH